MNIILLSGGSGKRLWPLSNDVRSKQFIKLFKAPESVSDGDEGVSVYESMVQRVYRQIKTMDKNATVTIATSKSQVSAIRNQLGENVQICIEPMRRDTFPAIALASAYLHDEKGVDLDEIVIVCPVDPYVNDSYFNAVKKLNGLAKSGDANIYLMGIEPTYPSEKYGYIIPETSKVVSPVKEFKEKPDRETAEEYIRQGALWNAGVFAFKLSYILSKAHELIDFRDYRDLYSKYFTLTRISFDYAVAEKEASISVLRYSGPWKDVGTWNMLAEVMPEPTIGNVTLDFTCKNVNVLNELNVPILVMGGRNLVVAASNDGILVADKEQSGYMKPYVEKISTGIHYAEKSWGEYKVVDVGTGYLIVKVCLKAGNRMSYHSHELRDEIWVVLQGHGRTIIDGMEQNVSPGDVVTMAAGCKHTAEAMTDLTLLEIQVGESISVKDKTKYEMEIA